VVTSSQNSMISRALIAPGVPHSLTRPSSVATKGYSYGSSRCNRTNRKSWK